MRDQPDIQAILGLAAASPETALVARAQAIAAREKRGAGAYDAIRMALQRLYGAAPDEALLARLAADIRAGRFDAPKPERLEVERLLWALAVQKLRESNPGFLSMNSPAATM